MSPGPTAKAKKPRDPWLVMLYLAGDTNLTEDMVFALQDLLAEGVAPEDRIVAQLDPVGVGLATARFDLTPKPRNTGRRATQPARYSRTRPHPALDEFRVKDIVDQSSGSVETLGAFIEWAIEYDTDQRQHNNEDTKATKVPTHPLGSRERSY